MTDLDRVWWTERLTAMTEPERDRCVLGWTLRLVEDVRRSDFHPIATRTYLGSIGEVVAIRNALPLKEIV